MHQFCETQQHCLINLKLSASFFLGGGVIATQSIMNSRNIIFCENSDKVECFYSRVICRPLLRISTENTERTLCIKMTALIKLTGPLKNEKTKKQTHTHTHTIKQTHKQKMDTHIKKNKNKEKHTKKKTKKFI